MKIAVPVNEDRETVCVSFGRTPLFAFHETESGRTEFLENPAAEAEGGAGIQAAQFLVDQAAEVLITVRCGQNAAEVFQEAGIRIFKSEGESLAGNLDAFREGKLAVLTRFHAGYHGIR